MNKMTNEKKAKENIQKLVKSFKLMKVNMLKTKYWD